MKRVRTIRLFMIAFSMFMELLLTSCGLFNNGINNNSKETDTASYAYDVIQFNLKKFNDPASVVCTDLSDYYIDGCVQKVTIAAKNGFGGTTSESYYFVVKSFDCTRELFDRMYGEEKNREYSGTSYTTWYEFYDNYYNSPTGPFKNKTGYTFLEFSFFKSMLLYTSSTNASYVFDLIKTKITETTPSKETVSGVNAKLTEYKKSQGWI